MGTDDKARNKAQEVKGGIKQGGEKVQDAFK